MSNRQYDDYYDEPAYQDPRYAQPQRQSQYQDPRYVQPQRQSQYQDPRYAQQQYQDPRYAPQYQDPRYTQQQYQDPRYARNNRHHANVIYPTFADRTPRASVNTLRQPPTKTETLLTTVGLQQSATGKYKVPMREKRGFMGVLASVATLAIATPVLLVYGACKAVSNVIKEDKYDDDSYFEEELYPQEIYEQRQNTRTRVYNEGEVYHQTPKKSKNSLTTNLLNTSKAAIEDKKERILNSLYTDIKNSSRASMGRYFDNDYFNNEEHTLYHVGDIIEPNKVYEYDTTSCIEIDLKQGILKEFSNFEFKTHVVKSVPVKDITFAREYILAFDKINYTYDLLKKGTTSDKFVNIILDLQTFREDKGEFISEFEDKHIKLKTSSVAIQSPPGISLKIKFMVVE